MENLTERQLMIIKYSLIQARQKYYDITSNLFISGNDMAFVGVTTEVKALDEILDKIDEILKSKQK